MDGHKITAAEVEKAMVKMKSGKATRSDGIELELVNALGSFGVEKNNRDSESCLYLGGHS